MTAICQQCGAEFERNPEETYKEFCSPACYHKYKAQTRRFTCPYNAGVECTKEKQKCHRCGWYPVVAKSRKTRLLGARGVT